MAGLIKLGKIDMGLRGEEDLRKMSSVLVWTLGLDHFPLNVGAVKFSFIFYLFYFLVFIYF